MTKLASHTDIQPGDLPPIAQELVEIIGMAATLALIDALGGTRVYLAPRVDPDHLVTGLIGLNAAERLCQYAGGDHMEVPRAARALREIRNRSIRAAYGDGASQNALAREHRLTNRQIRSIIGEVIDRRQIPLL